MLRDEGTRSGNSSAIVTVDAKPCSFNCCFDGAVVAAPSHVRIRCDKHYTSDAC